MIQPAERQFLPKDFVLHTWGDLEPYFQQLDKEELSLLPLVKKWLQHWSELDAVIGEDACWRQIKMTCDTTDPAAKIAGLPFS
jgi:oligoendopeptidase F